MATLPYAELAPSWSVVSPQDNAALLNDLDVFPPLYLSEQNPNRASNSRKRSITAQPLQNDLQQLDWQLVEGIIFSSTGIMGGDDDQWEDIDYSAVVPYHSRSFAEVAEHAGTDHHAPIPNDRFLQWPKAQYVSRQLRRRLQSFHLDDDSESSGMYPYDLFEQAKSRSRMSRHRTPLAYQRREQVYLTKTCQEFRCSMSIPMQNFGWLAALSSQQIGEIQSKTHYTQAKLDWLNERTEQLHQDNDCYRPLSKKTTIFARVLMYELVERGKIEVPDNSDDDNEADESDKRRRPKGFWEKKRKRDIARKQKFLHRQTPFSQYNSVVHYLHQQKYCGPMDKWLTFYNALRDLYQEDLANLTAEEAVLVKQVDDDNNREQVLRGILKFVSLYHFICKRDRDPAGLRYKKEHIQKLIADHWRDPWLN